METIEQKQIRQRFTRAWPTYGEHAVAQQRIARHLASLLPVYTGAHFKRALEIGCGNGGFTRELQRCARIDEWVLNDLCDACFPAVHMLFPDFLPVCLPGDATSLRFPGTYELIASASTFQWITDLPALFEKLSALSEPSGILLFSTFLPDNLHEIRQLTGKGLPYPTRRQIEAWLAPFFHILHAEDTKISLSFPTPLDVLKHLKYTGVTATSGGTIWTRTQQDEFCRRYRRLFATETHQVTLTYQPLYILAVKK